MQGLERFVPTDLKVDYLNALLKVGYHTLDCGSFVSPRAIPQMRDTAEVLDRIDSDSSTLLSVIVANERGIDDAVQHDRVTYLGYPFSISETFQQRNTNRSVEESLPVVEHLLTQTSKAGKEVVIYISMGFGNPYGDAWQPDLVASWVERLIAMGITSFSISDTVGVSDADKITSVFELLRAFDQAEFGAHFHTRPDDWKEKVDAAWKSGCARFDGAISGFGGCPMAADKLVGNMPTENLISYFDQAGISTGLDEARFNEARVLAAQIFG